MGSGEGCKGGGSVEEGRGGYGEMVLWKGYGWVVRGEGFLWRGYG